MVWEKAVQERGKRKLQLRMVRIENLKMEEKKEKRQEK
jgi:hypothetical protein